jgi:CRP-like cAMP-binding protein
MLKKEFYGSDSMLRILLRYIQALLTQIELTAICNQHHGIEQRLCRFLLLCLDRLPSNELAMTQDLIANMLGVRREGITEAARKLQNAHLIDYRRGHISDP